MKKLLIDITAANTYTALSENNRLTELFIDPRPANAGSGGSWVGRVIVGRIKTILPGQFAFVDIGAKKNAFINLQKGHGLKAGTSLLVQVQKDAVGTKGMCVGLEIALKGRFTVLCVPPKVCASAPTVGISRKIDNEKEARRLRKIVWKVLPAGFSAIVRTNAEGVAAAEIAAELESLHNMYHEITAHAEFVKPPHLLFPTAQGTAVPGGLLTDILSDELGEIHINAEKDEDFTTLEDTIRELMPGMEKRIFRTPLNLKKQIRTALQKEVRLPCGGFITVEQTEACVVIDVNTGSNVGNTDYSTTVLETNLEAATVVAEQIRLRNLSGIILVDFIDMPKEHDKTVLLERLSAEIKKDRIKTEIAGFVGLGMVQLTRRKTRPPISEFMEEPCPSCRGKGTVWSDTVSIL